MPLPRFLTRCLCLLAVAWGGIRLAGGAPAAETEPRAAFNRLLAAGDSAYAQRQSYESISTSLKYFDRAYALVEYTHDTLLLAEAVFAKGRVYDAWNKDPVRTIGTMQRAVALFGRVPAARLRYYYARYLLVHAYDKVPDPPGTVRAARTLYRELRTQPVAVRQQVPTTTELAWSCTEVGAYALADSVLRHLTQRAWIRNDPASYDHLTHYYLVRARLDILYHHRPASAYLDSLATAYQRATNLFDRAYYSRSLGTLYAAVGQYPLAYACLNAHRLYSDSLGDHTEVRYLRQALVASANRAEASRRAQEAQAHRRRLATVGGLLIGLLGLAALAFYFYRQNRRVRAQATQLTHTNAALDQKVAQVEVLNKEIQHRVKNNLHMIFSLLQMQERQTDNEEVIAYLQTARLRVESIATLHNQLLTDVHGLDLAPYLRGLISGVVACLANDKQVVTHLQTDVLHLPERAYLPLSLILNEWVTNSIKYATPAAGPLEINVRVQRQPTEVCLTYYDNGAPATATTAARAPGLGTQIIGLLRRQLGATLTTPPGQSYHYELCIPNGTRA